jgi:hypothetical protein
MAPMVKAGPAGDMTGVVCVCSGTRRNDRTQQGVPRGEKIVKARPTKAYGRLAPAVRSGTVDRRVGTSGARD